MRNGIQIEAVIGKDKNLTRIIMANGIILFIINPNSGNGRGRKVWSLIEKKLANYHLRYDYVFTEGPEDAIQKVRQFKERYSAPAIRGIVAVGGDGTMNEVVNGMMQYGLSVPFGYIPAGSGNDFARGLKLGDWESALAHILAGFIKPIDLGKVNDHWYFINSVGAGFDGEVAAYANQSRIKDLLNRIRLGKFTYLISMLKTLFAYKRNTLTLRCDGVERKYGDTWLVAVGNTPSYGGGMSICPDADPHDGKFQVCVVYRISVWGLLKVFPKVYKGAHKGHWAVDLFDATEIEIDYERPYHSQMDGEVKNKTPVSIKMIPKALMVFHPSPSKK